MHSPRSSLLAAAFRDAPLTCGPLTLRPLTAGSMMLLMESGNILFTADDDATAGAPDGTPENLPMLTQAAQLSAFFEYIWIHSAPLDEVIAADAESIRRNARAVALQISFDDLTDFTRQFSELRQRMAAATIGIVPDGDARPGKQEPSRIGSPASCTPSAAPEIRPGNISCCGSAPSSERSNTCMPPMPQAEPGAAGRSPIWGAEETGEDLSGILTALP